MQVTTKTYPPTVLTLIECLAGISDPGAIQFHLGVPCSVLRIRPSRFDIVVER